MRLSLDLGLGSVVTLNQGGGVVSPARTYDFVARTYSSDGASVAEADAINGTVRTFTDEFTAENLGARTDPAYTNLAAAISFNDAVVGVVGSGGALPAAVAWNAGLTFGMTVEVVAKSANSLRLKLTGTPSSSGNMYFTMGSTSAITVAASALSTMGMSVELIAASVSSGSVPAFIKMTRELTAAGAFVANRLPEGNNIRFSGSGPVPVTWQRTMSGTTGRVQPGFGMIGISSSMVDLSVEFEISALSVTAGEGRMPFGTGAVSADDLTLKGLTLPAAFAGVGTFRLPPDTSTGTILQAGDTANHVKFRHTNYRVYASIVTASGAAVETALGYVVPWMANRIAFSISGGDLLASLNGKAAVNCGAAPSVSGLKLGGGVSGALRGSFESFDYYDAGLSATALQVKSALGASALYDDFDRVDGELVTAWTEQAYQITGTSLDTGIVSNRVVTADSGGATTSAYFTVEMPAQVNVFGGMVSFENAAGSVSCGLITTPNNTVSAAAGITDLSNHFLFGPGGLFAGTFLNDALTLHEFAFRTVLTKDDATLHTVAWKMNGDGHLAVRVPTGEVVLFRDTDFGASGGVFTIPESYWDVANPARPKWACWGAETA